MLNLRKLREERNLSLAEVARKSGISIRTLEDVEARGDCRLSTIRKIALALDVDLYNIVSVNRVYASLEPDPAKALLLSPPYRTPSMLVEVAHFADAADMLRAKYESEYPHIFNAKTVHFFSIDEDGKPKPFEYSQFYRVDEDEGEEE